MSILREILPGITTWSEFSEEKQLDFNGYYAVHRGESVLIDPPGLGAEGLEELQARVGQNTDSPLKAILLTNVHHDRMSRELGDKFRIPVCIHEKDRDALEFAPDRTFKEGDPFFCGLRILNFQDQKSPGESAFLVEERKILIVGDALIGRIPGRVNLLPPDKYRDIRRAREGLRILRDYDFEVLLVGDGAPILEDAKARVMDFLNEEG